MTTIVKTRLLCVMGGAILLAACGGGSSDVVTAPPALIAGTDLPMAVEQSTTGLIAFAKTQLAATSETSDPLIVGNAKLATDDSAEPSDV